MTPPRGVSGRTRTKTQMLLPVQTFRRSFLSHYLKIKKKKSQDLTTFAFEMKRNLDSQTGQARYAKLVSQVA